MSAADFIGTNGPNKFPLFLQCPISKLKTVDLAEMWRRLYLFMFTRYSKMFLVFITHRIRAERTMSAEMFVILWICELS